MTKYRLSRNFNGTWDIQHETKVSRYDHESGDGRHVIATIWERNYSYPPNMKYAQAKKELETLLAKEAYIPVILVPPLPAKDPSKKSFFKLLSNFS